MVISCQELSGPACLCNGGSAGPQSFSSTQRIQTLKGGPARAKIPLPPYTHIHTHSISTQWLPQTAQLAAGDPDGKAFIKILLFNGLFSLHDRKVTKQHISVSDPAWLCSMPQPFIKALTVDGFYLESTYRFLLPLIFRQLKMDTMSVLCLRGLLWSRQWRGDKWRLCWLPLREQSVLYRHMSWADMHSSVFGLLHTERKIPFLGVFKKKCYVNLRPFPIVHAEQMFKSC